MRPVSGVDVRTYLTSEELELWESLIRLNDLDPALAAQTEKHLRELIRERKVAAVAGECGSVSYTKRSGGALTPPTVATTVKGLQHD